MKIGFFIKGLYQYTHLIKPLIHDNSLRYSKVYIFHINNLYNYYKVEFAENNIELVNLCEVKNIVKILSEFHPDWMIFFNPGHIYDVFLTLVSKELNIKTLYCQHGLSLDFGSFNIKTISQGKSKNDKLQSLKRYFFFYSSILISIWFVRTKLKILTLLILRSKQIFLNYGSSNYPKYGLKNNHCDFAIVFGQYDKRYLQNKNGFIENEIIIGGYPMLELSDNNDIGRLPENYILYISSGLLVAKVIPITIEEERLYYRKLAKIVIKNNYNLVIKLHPTENLDQFKSYFDNIHNVFIYKDYNLANITYKAELVLGDYSTALFYAIKYYKPIILLQSKYFKKYPFDYSDFGIGIKSDLKDLKKYITGNLNINKEVYESFISEYISNNSKRNVKEIFSDTILTK